MPLHEDGQSDQGDLRASLACKDTLALAWAVSLIGCLEELHAAIWEKISTLQGFTKYCINAAHIPTPVPHLGLPRKIQTPHLIRIYNN